MYKDNKYLILDDSENVYFIILFNNYIEIKKFENELSVFLKENHDWFYEDIEKFIKDNYDVKYFLIFDKDVNCKQLFDFI